MAMKREVKVGIFITVFFILLIVFMIFVGDMLAIFKSPGYRIYAVFDSALGLEKSASVKMAGIKIGMVEDIALDGRQARVTMSILPEYQIPSGSKATLASLGVLGEKYVEIVPSQENTFYPPEAVMDSLPSVSFDQLGSLIMSMGGEIKKAVNSVNHALEKDLGPNLNRALVNLESLTGELDGLVKENRAAVHQTVVTTNETISNINQQVEKVAASLQETVSEINSLVKENRSGVQNNLQKLEEALGNLEGTLTTLRQILEKVDQGQGTVGKLINEPELYDQARATVEEVNKITSSVKAMELFGGVQGTYYGQSELFRGQISGGFLWRGQGLLEAGLIHNPWEDKFVYSLQAGWGWRSLVFRGGVIESSFGAGLDWYLLNRRLAISAEGFDFNRDPKPQFRLYGRIYPVQNVYLIVGLDDFSLASRREFFFGLGLELR